MSKTKISIVAVTFNGIDLIAPFINSIYKSSLNKDEVEIIILDNASNDGTADFIEINYPLVKLIRNKKNKGTAAFNDATNITKGEYLLITDPDMIFEKNCLENFYKTAKRLGKGIALSPTLYEYDNKEKLMSSYSILSRSFYSLFINPKHINLKLKEIFMAGFIFFHRDMLKKLGYVFDNDYFLYGEDFDLCLRIRLLGFKLYTCPDTIMYNKPPSHTSKRYIGQARITYYLERNMLITFFKICSAKTLILYFPFVVFARFCAMVKDLITINHRIFLSRVKAYLWVIFNLDLILKKRRLTQKIRIKNDKYIFSISNDKYFIRSKLGFF
ncbi:MAG: glycosyltransferase [Nanoarchaeota archaeon]|nr:glycosyltransferase [Nanoarchaeota archaeon]